jgi:hypothetical protein
MDHSLASALAELRSTAHEVDPDTPVGIEGTQMPHAFGGYDLWRLSRVLDWVEPYDIAGARAIFGSFMPGKPIVSTINESNTRNAGQRLWHLLLEGDRGCIVWWSEDCIAWRDNHPELTEKARALQPVIRELSSPLARLFIRATREFDPVYIHYSQPSIQVDWLLESTIDGNTWHRRFSSYEAQHNRLAKERTRCLAQLRAAGLSPRFLSSEQLAAGLPADCQALLLIGSLAMSGQELAHLRNACADLPPGLFDEHGTLRQTPPPTGAKLLDDWTQAVTHVVPPVRVSPGAAVYRYRLGKARLLAIEALATQEMGEDLKLRGNTAATAVASTATLAAPCHVYDLRAKRYLGRTARLEFLLDPDHPAMFALLDAPLDAATLPDSLLPR